MLARRLGGGERVFLDVCGAVASRGHEVLAIGAAESDAMDALDQRTDLQCARVRCNGTWDPLCRWAIGRLLRRFEPDVVQTHMARASALGGKAARSAGYPTLAMPHTMINLKYYRAIDLFAPTTADLEDHLRRNDIPTDRIQRFPHFRSIEPVAAAKVPRKTDGVVKTLGRFVHKKGFDVLLRAVAIAAQRGVPFKLEIGGDGPESSSLKELADRLGIGGQVKFRGWIDDVATYFADADVFVLPSRSEAFGIVLLEAMACGVPIVATRVSGPLEILEEQTALLVPSDDPEALATAITSAFEAPDASHTRARAALTAFKANYAEQVVIERYLAACQRLVAASDDAASRP
ncbi:MAG: glycosyltransferase [Rhodospirillaceae bacterium]|nr:glycosyltransferase [Rhodospirillaceae bacterium]